MICRYYLEIAANDHSEIYLEIAANDHSDISKRLIVLHWRHLPGFSWCTAHLNKTISFYVLSK